MSQQLAVASEGGALATGGSSFEVAQPVIDSPRTRQACRKLGLVLEDLQHRPFDSFSIPGDRKEKQQLRFSHYEQRRRERLGQVLAERAKVIAENAKKGAMPGVQSAQFLGMLESLFEKEAKRLEGDLKSQLRHHSSLVNENASQLEKEQKCMDMKNLRQERVNQVEQMNQKRSLDVKSLAEKRKARQDANYSKIDGEVKDKQNNQHLELQVMQDRLDEFMKNKQAMNDQKAGYWRDKAEMMKEKTKQMQIKRFEDGEAALCHIGNRIAAVEQRRDEDAQKRSLMAEESHLHLMDTREQKNRIDRQDQYRRDELKEHIESQTERIETLLAIKEQLLDQRKARTGKAEATKNARGLNLRRDCAPGPGQYEIKTYLDEMPTTKFSTADTGNFIDVLTKVTALNPAPGQYDSVALSNGDRLDKPLHGGVNFGNRNRDSYLDDAINQKKAIPAPGRYEVKSMLDQRATKMRRESINDVPTNDKKNPRNFPTWSRPATDTPGPAGYSVDDYTRKAVLRRAQKSLPNLTRDMLRSLPPVMEHSQSAGGL